MNRNFGKCDHCEKDITKNCRTNDGKRYHLDCIRKIILELARNKRTFGFEYKSPQTSLGEIKVKYD